jgi:hypothetical protein
MGAFAMSFDLSVYPIYQHEWLCLKAEKGTNEKLSENTTIPFRLPPRSKPHSSPIKTTHSPSDPSACPSHAAQRKSQV